MQFLPAFYQFSWMGRDLGNALPIQESRASLNAIFISVLGSFVQDLRLWDWLGNNLENNSETHLPICGGSLPRVIRTLQPCPLARKKEEMQSWDVVLSTACEQEQDECPCQDDIWEKISTRGKSVYSDKIQSKHNFISGTTINQRSRVDQKPKITPCKNATPTPDKVTKCPISSQFHIPDISLPQ